jgi:hypothetical protein
MLSENYAGRKEQSYEIMKMLVYLENGNPNPGNIRGLNMAIKIEPFRRSKLQLQQKLLQKA